MPKIMERWTPEHKKIRRQLMKFKWSMEELRWWEKHSKGWPISLAQLLAEMMVKAQQEQLPL